MKIQKYWGFFPLCSVCFLQVSTIYNIDWFIRQQVSLSIYLELSSNRRLNAACLFLVIFSLHIAKFSIKFQWCTFSLENLRYLSSQSRWFRLCLPCTVPRYLSANLSTSQALKWFPSFFFAFVCLPFSYSLQPGYQPNNNNNNMGPE